MQKIAYVDCHSGVSGDMFLGALLDAGLSLTTLKEQLAALPVQGYHVGLEPFADKGIRGSRLQVVLDESEQPTRHFSDIVAILHASTLAPRVRERAIAIFRCLAEAEAAVHGSRIEEVHFHEVGALDALVDITGAAIGVEALGILQVYASALPWTSGHVQMAHGVLPVPAPATLEILRRVSAPWKPCAAEGELVTPTGAAILATLARFEVPAMTIETVGYGFGHKQFPWPNCLRCCVGYTQDAVSQRGDADTDWVTVIESHIDTMTGEMFGGVMERLFAAGALDVSYTPLQMKKNRPATLVTVIASLTVGDALAETLLRETNTLGVRVRQEQRLKAQRSQERVMTPFGPLVVKVKRLGARILSIAPEYEECQRVATQRHIPLAEVYEIVSRAAQAALIQENE